MSFAPHTSCILREPLSLSLKSHLVRQKNFSQSRLVMPGPQPEHDGVRERGHGGGGGGQRDQQRVNHLQRRAVLQVPAVPQYCIQYQPLLTTVPQF